MAELFGAAMPEIPSLNITGFFSSTWVYVFVIFILGVVLLAGIGLLLFFKTYNKKIVLFENISGQGYQPVLKTRARVIKLGVAGEELLKTLAQGMYVSAYGRKMGKNTYWFAKHQDGFWYNIVLGDLDGKMAMLDVEPVDRDVRMMYVAIDKQSNKNYGESDKMAKIMMYGTVFIFLLILVVGMYGIVGKYNEGKAAELETAKLNQQVLEAINVALDRLASMPYSGGSGLIPVGV